jgi:hypothetical protein
MKEKSQEHITKVKNEIAVVEGMEPEIWGNGLTADLTFGTAPDVPRQGPKSRTVLDNKKQRETETEMKLMKEDKELRRKVIHGSYCKEEKWVAGFPRRWEGRSWAVVVIAIRDSSRNVLYLKLYSTATGLVPGSTCFGLRP